MNQKNIKNKGFTLIELLVVIAIIGILSGIIMVNVGDPSTKAKIARIKANMDSIRSEFEIYKVENNLKYPANAAATGTTATKLISDINTQGGTLIQNYDETNGKGYCIKVVLPGGGGNWCVDGTGYVGTAAVCNDTVWTCN